MIVTPGFLDEFRKEFDAAVEPLREKYDISISLGNITYEQERFSATMNVNMTRDPEDIARANFDAESYKFLDIGINPGMYKRIFIAVNGKKYAIVALKPRSYKAPLRIIDIEDGRRYKANRQFVSKWTDSYYAEVLDEKEFSD